MRLTSKVRLTSTKCMGRQRWSGRTTTYVNVAKSDVELAICRRDEWNGLTISKVGYNSFIGKNKLQLKYLNYTTFIGVDPLRRRSSLKKFEH